MLLIAALALVASCAPPPPSLPPSPPPAPPVTGTQCCRAICRSAGGGDVVYSYCAPAAAQCDVAEFEIAAESDIGSAVTCTLLQAVPCDNCIYDYSINVFQNPLCGVSSCALPSPPPPPSPPPAPPPCVPAPPTCLQALTEAQCITAGGIYQGSASSCPAPPSSPTE